MYEIKRVVKYLSSVLKRKYSVKFKFKFAKVPVPI